MHHSLIRIYENTEINEYVIGFSLVLGVYMFGLQVGLYLTKEA